MSHQFTITLPPTSDMKTIVDTVKSQLLANGGTFTGDSIYGVFSISGVSGTYHSVGSQQVLITIEKKPFLYPMSAIESKVRSYFTA